MTNALERGEFDGYVTPVVGGFEVGAAGRVIDVVPTRSLAETILAEHCAARPRWYVERDGDATLIGTPE